MFASFVPAEMVAVPCQDHGGAMDQARQRVLRSRFFLLFAFFRAE